MAKRLATHFVKTCLQLSEAELLEFVKAWSDQQVASKIKVLENGSQEIVFADLTTGEEVVMTFARKHDRFEMNNNIQVQSSVLAELLRKAVVRYHGNATVFRVYSGFTVHYLYDKGIVVKITEMSKGTSKVIFEYRNKVEELEHLYQVDLVERDIKSLREQVDQLLDLRNLTKNISQIRTIDQQLQELSSQLFVLEA